MEHQYTPRDGSCLECGFARFFKEQGGGGGSSSSHFNFLLVWPRSAIKSKTPMKHTTAAAAPHMACAVEKYSSGTIVFTGAAFDKRGRVWRQVYREKNDTINPNEGPTTAIERETTIRRLRRTKRNMSVENKCFKNSNRDNSSRSEL